MTQKDALVFNKIAQFVLFNEHGTQFLYRNNYHYSKKCNINVNEFYGITDKELNILDECGILRPWSSDTVVNFNENDSLFFNLKGKPLALPGVSDYILDLGLFFKNEYPELKIGAYKIKK